MQNNHTRISAVRYHDICCGHRVVGHENKCRFLHGHNYRIHFFATAIALDSVGRVLDFSILKSRLCNWLEENYDHKFLVWKNDPLLDELPKNFIESFVIVPYNPTAENIAEYLLKEVCPRQLSDTSVYVHKVIVEETAKCRAVAVL